jgi:hypothetical protein
VSGVYEAKLVREDGIVGRNRVLFVVRDDASTSPILLSTADATWVAYNTYGGNSLYKGTTSAPNGRAYKVSYNRPLANRDFAYDRRNTFFNAEYPLVRWLERNGYHVSYTTEVDLARDPGSLRDHAVFMTAGHNEYISKEERQAMAGARSAGVHLAFFAGNDVYWKTRWEPSIDTSRAPYRTLVCYKEGNKKIDPSPIWTGLWRDARLSPPYDAGPPENELVGTIFGSAQGNTAVRVPSEYGRLRFWRNTSIATLQTGQTATLAPGTLGWEWNEDQDNGWRPSGLIRLTETTLTVSHRVGLTWTFGPATHHATLYRAASGAFVFSSGTIRWSWGLDATHDEATAASQPDIRMQQATLNLLADMGVQPGSIQPGLVPAAPSGDVAAPVASITFPSDGAVIAEGSSVRIEGTASDTQGSVAAIEISTDGGLRWHPVRGWNSWTYTWQPVSSGPHVILVRATDDSGNVQSPVATRTVAVRA